MLQRTLTFIKPDAMNEGHVGEIVSMIEAAGFRLVAAKIQYLTKDDAARFYEVHRGKDFFEGLIEYASSGPILALCIEKDDAIEDLRTLVGMTDPKEAAEGTIRALYGHTVRKNSIHASDGTATAEREIRFFFPDIEAKRF
jgi:nucleoside-diphosphate kinase